MIYYLLYSLKDTFFGFNVTRYITFRAAMAAATALILSIVLGPLFIRFLYSLKIGQQVRKEECKVLYAIHKDKQGTPTMGGILIIFSILASVLMWGDIFNSHVLISLFTLAALGMVGFIDDYAKIKKKQSLGLTSKAKLLWQSIVGLVICLYIYTHPVLKDISPCIEVPFLKNATFCLGAMYFVLVMLVILGSSNAVNLTDGLDGLAIGCIIIAFATFGILAYIAGHAKFCEYLNVAYVPNVGELSVVCAATVGAGLGFLWFNAPPAQVFMGDTGSLALGGLLGVIALLVKKEILLVITGGVFVMEAGSVILQVGSYKTRRKRIFRVAPLHHHFEVGGWAETKVTIRMWIISIIFALLTLATLKLR